MKTTERFTKAVTKLYNAFHNGELQALSCKHCAVGNLCDNNGNWIYAPGLDSFLALSTYTEESIKLIKSTGYSVKEIDTIETIFLFNTYNTKNGEYDKNFEGLCAVVEYLCKLDNIPNIMDYTSLFETENKKELETVFN